VDSPSESEQEFGVVRDSDDGTVAVRMHGQDDVVGHFARTLNLPVAALILVVFDARIADDDSVVEHRCH
jgi:hypothetical protein